MGSSKTCLKQTLKKNTIIGFQDQLSLNAGQKYCRMLQGEHSAILSTFIKLPYAIKIFILSICEWSLKTGFTVFIKLWLNIVTIYLKWLNDYKAFKNVCLCRAFCCQSPVLVVEDHSYRVESNDTEPAEISYTEAHETRPRWLWWGSNIRYTCTDGQYHTRVQFHYREQTCFLCFNLCFNARSLGRW